MQKKSILVLFAAGLLFATFFGGVADAQSFTQNLRNAADTLRESIINPIEKFTENTVAFVRFLFFILVFLIIVAVLRFTPLFTNQPGIKVLVAFIISILAVFFIPSDLISPLLNPYSAMGVAMISIIPFVLMIIFTNNMLTNAFVRQVAWMFFAITLLGMAVYTTLLQYNNPKVYGNYLFGAVYGVTSLLALSMVYFNRTIRNRLWVGKLEGAAERARRDRQLREEGRRQEREEAISRLSSNPAPPGPGGFGI